MAVSEQQKYFVEEVRTLYERSFLSIPLNYVTSTLCVLVLFSQVPNKPLLSWLLAVVVVTTVRTAHVYWVIKHVEWNNYALNYRNIYVIAALMGSILWAALFFTFAFEIPEAYMLFIIFVLGGMVIGAASSMATSRLAYLCYITPMMIPPALVFLLEADIFGFSMSALLFVLYAVLVVTFIQNYNIFRESVKLKFEKDGLIEELKDTNRELEGAYERIMSLSNTDELTTVPNRRALDMTLKKEWGRALRANQPMSFIMVDIDYFKDYNDFFGHQEGDKCLKRIAMSIQELVKRPGDVFARYGGEEFCLILPDTDIKGASALAERVKEKVLNLKIPAANKSVSEYVTISLGVSCIIPAGKTIPEDLIYAADKALYFAKNHGRNRVESWEADV